MTRNLIILVIISGFLFSCGNQQKQTENNNDKSIITAVSPIVVSIAEFDDTAETLTGKAVSIEGIVDHVCMHGGDKMFIIDDNSKGRVKITVGENMPAFNTEWVGKSIKVEGIVEELRIDEDYLNDWENELLANNEESEKGKGLDKQEKEGEGDHKTSKGKNADQGEHIDGFKQIENLRAEIAETEKGYLVYYSIVCSEYKFATEPKAE